MIGSKGISGRTFRTGVIGSRGGRMIEVWMTLLFTLARCCGIVRSGWASCCRRVCSRALQSLISLAVDLVAVRVGTGAWSGVLEADPLLSIETRLGSNSAELADILKLKAGMLHSDGAELAAKHTRKGLVI